jgi:seryl-tRNA synthetase
MNSYLTEQELTDYKEGKASAEVVDKVKMLTATNFLPKTRFDEVTKERDNIKGEVTNLTAKLAEIEKKATADLKAKDDELVKLKAEQDKALLQLPGLQAKIDQAVKDKEAVTKDATAYTELKRVTVEEARKILADKWQPEFEMFDVTKITKLVLDMTGKPIASIFTAPKGKSSQDIPLSPREMIQQGMTQKN